MCPFCAITADKVMKEKLFLMSHHQLDKIIKNNHNYNLSYRSKAVYKYKNKLIREKT